MPNFAWWNWDWLFIPGLAILTGIIGVGYEWLAERVTKSDEDDSDA